MSRPPGAPEPVDGRDLIHEFVRREVEDMEARRKELTMLLWRTGLDYAASTFEMHCPSCAKIGGGNCEECSSYHDGVEPFILPHRRAWRYVDKCETECWLWRGPRNSKGYAIDQVEVLHRLFFSRANPETDISDLVVHHLCRVKHCVNPAHLEALTKSAHGTRHYREANP